MLVGDITKEKFEEISKTGYQVVILRDIEKCSCTNKKPQDKSRLENSFIEDELLLEVTDDIEVADPNCPMCLGTGRKLFPILSNKIRVTNAGNNLSVNGNLEIQLVELVKNDTLVFYFPYNYEFLTMKDYIAVVKMDSQNNVILPVEYVDIYKINNIEIFVRNEFKYYKIYGIKKKVI